MKSCINANIDSVQGNVRFELEKQYLEADKKAKFRRNHNLYDYNANAQYLYSKEEFDARINGYNSKIANFNGEIENILAQIKQVKGSNISRIEKKKIIKEKRNEIIRLSKRKRSVIKESKVDKANYEQYRVKQMLESDPQNIKLHLLKLIKDINVALQGKSFEYYGDKIYVNYVSIILFALFSSLVVDFGVFNRLLKH